MSYCASYCAGIYIYVMCCVLCVFIVYCNMRRVAYCALYEVRLCTKWYDFVLRGTTLYYEGRLLVSGYNVVLRGATFTTRYNFVQR